MDPKYSRWISTDPALGEYIPSLDKEKNSNLPGLGGIYNAVNLNLYHYAGNNPVKYTDPDGNVIHAVVAAVAKGALIGAGTSAATNAGVQVAFNMMRGQDFDTAVDNIDWKSVKSSAISGAITGGLSGGLSSVTAIKNIVSVSKKAKGIMNASTNMAGTTVGTMADNAAHNKPLSKNLVRNNLIAGFAGCVSANISTTAAGNVVSQTGEKTPVWFETLDQGGNITSMTAKEPFDIAVNNFVKESLVSAGQEFLTSSGDK